MIRLSLVVVAYVLLLSSPLIAQDEPVSKPNIILFMTDDMGMECLECYGGETYQTPNLDRLADKGMRFTNCFSQPLCTPSRVKIMTGRYNFRNYTQFKHLDPNQKTIGHIAKQAGYRTAVCGKWQLDGDQEDDFARKFGFDSYCLWYLNQKNFGSRYANPKLVRDGKTIVANGKYGPDIVNGFALNFLAESKDEPFLLYYPMILPHFPFEPTPDSEEWDPTKALPKPKNATAKLARDQKYFKDMVEYADKMVGNVVDKVDELGLSENTIILFTSDNGTMRTLTSRWNGQNYKGGKGFLNNQGTHVPLIAAWTGTIEAGSKADSLIDFTDFFATIAEATGQPPEDGNLNGYPVDGIGFLSLLKGEEFKPRKYTYCHYEPKWGTPETGQWVRNERFKVYGSGMVYNMKDDYFEKTPLKTFTDQEREQVDYLISVLAKKKSEGSNPPEKLKRKQTTNLELNPRVRVAKIRKDDDQPRPNIVLVMADDQGWGDAGFADHPKLKTPNMDSMAGDSIVFERFYSAAPVCSPTRAAVLTGRSPIRVNVPNHGHYLRPQESTLAEALKASGYVTGHFGKWHIGSVQPKSPTNPSGAGFDEWLSGLNFFDIDPYLSRNGRYEQVEGQGSVISMDETLKFLRKHKDGGKPMFAVTWFPAPHDPHREEPVQLPEGVAPYHGDHQGYYREIQLIDQQLGRLRQSLREMKIDKNTIVFYCSDNGGLVNEHSGGRARKGSIYEGGLRVPAMMEWPGRLSPGITKQPFYACDIYPTLLQIANVAVENQAPLDGVDMMPLIRAELNSEVCERPSMGFWHLYTGGQSTHSDRIIKAMYSAQRANDPTPFPNRILKNVNEFQDVVGGPLTGHAAFNDWPWKIHRIEKEGEIRIELYHLLKDPRESNDVSDSEIERTRRMRKELEAWQRSVLKSYSGKDYRN